MFRRRFVVAAAVLALSAGLCRAEHVGPGKYSGVVIFDRWGGCIFYRGVYVLYISEAIKGELKGEAGKCIQVDATQVGQVMNPGEAVIKKLTVLGPAPPIPPSVPEGVKLVVAPAFDDGHAPEFTIRVENGTQQPILLHMDDLGPTVLGKREIKNDARRFFDVLDGESQAIITNQSLWTVPGDQPRRKIKGGNWQWEIKQPLDYTVRTTLRPTEAFEVRISFKLPAGEYEFLAGYGGNFSTGQCIASNLLAFDVKADGSASLVKVAGR